MTGKQTTIADLILDGHNANKGTERGRKLLEDSLQELGAGRSILVDKNDRIIAGNKTVEMASVVGLSDLIVVETDGTKLVVVKRTDLDLEKDETARKLAYADNRVAELDLEWNAEELAKDLNNGVDLSEMFTESEIDALMAKVAIPESEPEYDESAADDVKKVICPKCGHEFPV